MFQAPFPIDGSPSLSTRLTPTTPTKLTLDLESLQLRCKQLQEELAKTRRGWSSDREEFHLRESKLEANLTAARKANAELEVSDNRFHSIILEPI